MNIQSQILTKNRTIIFILSLSFFMFSGFVYAEKAEEELENPQYNINLDKATIAKGYTVNAFDNYLKLSLVPGILDEATDVEVIQINEKMEMPWNLDKISKIYQFEFKNKNAYDNHKPFYIQFSYDEADNNYKQVFFYDKNYNAWRPLPTKDYPKEKFVRSLIHLPFARIAVLSNSNILTVGRASWYGYKGGNFAASPDFPKKSRLRVHNTENNKFVDVIINDYGPDRKLHPDRVIDLDKVAFKKIASLGEGIVDVRIETLYIAPDNTGKILGISESVAVIDPIITSKSAVIIDEDSEIILFNKNATTTMPLASLTKLVAIKVFLDTRPSLNKVVAYDKKDEEYNYQYCKKWESARVKLNDKDTLTIENLVYSSLVGSANNTIETLVRLSGLPRDDFIKKMNEVVAKWGTVATNFIEPTGLSPENVSSTLDCAIITKEVFKNPIIQKASTMPEYEFYTVNTNERHKLKNTNHLISSNKYNIVGSKTGYLDEAGYCLMTRVRLGKKFIIIVTMGASSRDISFSETEELIKYGLRKL